MTIENNVSSRRTLVKGAAWAAPVVALSSVMPAYAASTSTKNTCTATPVVDDFSWLYYDWGKNSPLSGTTTQYLLMHSGISGANLPSDALITSITSEIWIQERRDVTLANKGSGSRGPGIYRPTHANSSVKNLGPSYQGTSAVSNTITASGLNRSVSPVFTSSEARVELMTSDAFTWLLADNKTTYTSKAWGIKWTGDASIANSLLTSDAKGCKTLPEIYTTEFQATYTKMLTATGYYKTIYADHIETIKYISEGVEKTVTVRYLGPDACSAKNFWKLGDGTSINRCSSPTGLS